MSYITSSRGILKMKKEVHIFSNNIDGKTLNQFYEAMKYDWAIKGALMPDAHLGYDMPIGGVIAVKDHIIPSFVGYDIGCGMCAVKTTAKKEDIYKHAKDIFEGIYQRIPVGFKHREKPYSDVSIDIVDWKATKWFEDMFYETGGLNQIGTLGGGNHFIEIGYDEEDSVWIIVHSGSRNIGHKTASHYMKIERLNQKKKGWRKALDVSSQNGQDYIQDMTFCLNFALENRYSMIKEVQKVINEYSDSSGLFIINRNHNHAEEKDGVWIHRKGATHAEKGMLGVIPGNMRDGAFIVMGLGNPDSLYSSSHGAGRVSSRKEAKKNLKMENFTKEMEGITAKVTEGTLDESRGAYKDIFEVMELQKDLVEVLHHVKPIINVKG